MMRNARLAWLSAIDRLRAGEGRAKDQKLEMALLTVISVHGRVVAIEPDLLNIGLEGPRIRIAGDGT